MTDEQCEFRLGFKALADMLEGVAGVPLENEHHSAENGDGLQRTSTGLMVWRKADNWTAFTDGYWTWINGPHGLQCRLNAERLEWELGRQVPSPVFERWDSPNCWRGRPYGPPIATVIHTEAGSEGGAEAVFMSPAAQVSAHYGVNLDADDDLDQFVPLDDRAWANGWLERGNLWGRIYTGLCDGTIENPNNWTVSVETEDHGNPAQPVTDVQFERTLLVCRQAQERFPSIKYLMTHRAISPRSRPNCPGRRWIESGRFAALAQELGLIAVV